MITLFFGLNSSEPVRLQLNIPYIQQWAFSIRPATSGPTVSHHKLLSMLHAALAMT